MHALQVTGLCSEARRLSSIHRNLYVHAQNGVSFVAATTGMENRPLREDTLHGRAPSLPTTSQWVTPLIFVRPGRGPDDSSLDTWETLTESVPRIQGQRSPPYETKSGDARFSAGRNEFRLAEQTRKSPRGQGSGSSEPITRDDGMSSANRSTKPLM